ncbi:MAG: hypothetical protein ACI9WC_000203 [Arenicella sp.]|jgi:hypothetical protein
MSTNYQTIAGSLLKEQKSPFLININGRCMHPILQSGDQVEVFPSAHYFPGDIVMFEHPLLGLTAHRLLGLTLSTRGLRYMTKADSTGEIDCMLALQKILGRLDKNLSQDLSVRCSITMRLRCVIQLVKITIVLALKKLYQG